MLHLLWIIPALVAGYYLLSFLLALWEKEHLRGDLVAQAYDPAVWQSEYLKERSSAAASLGLVHAGDYHTSPHASMVRGPMRLYLTPTGSTLVSLVSARFGGMELKKTVLRTRLSPARTLETSDSTGMSDPSGGTERQVLWTASLKDLLTAHEARLGAEPAPPQTSPEKAFAWYEQMELDRGARLVEQGLARWSDPGRSTIRRTVNGAIRTLRANRKEADTIMAGEKQKIAEAKRNR